MVKREVVFARIEKEVKGCDNGECREKMKGEGCVVMGKGKDTDHP